MMTPDEFLSTMHARGAIFAPPANTGTISLLNTNLQRLRAAMLPMFMIDLYSRTGGINLGNGYIFGPNEITPDGRTMPIPSIFDINNDISGIEQMRGKTIFGRNDLFWFGFDAFGGCIMFDNLGLNPLRKYDDPFRAMFDCLIAGKF